MRHEKTTKRYLDLADVIILVLNRKGEVSLINEKGCRILGYEEDEILGKNWFDHFLPANIRESLRSTFTRLLNGELQATEFYENPVLTGEGDIKYVAWRNSVIRDSSGAIQEILSTGEDVTQRRRTESALVESEAKLRAILETCVDGIITIDEKGIITSFNPAAERIFGYSAEEAMGRNVSLLMPEPYSQQHDRFIRNYLETHEAHIIGAGREVIGRRKDGSDFPLYLAVSDVSVQGEKMFTGIVRDLTDFKALQNKMVHSQKLAAIGEMAASVGHEIKNPLAGIGGAIEILKDTLAKTDSRREVMDDILSEVSRLDNTVRDLLAFAKPWNPELQSCNLVEIASRVSQNYREKNEGLIFDFSFDESDREYIAPVDPWLLEKILWNLLDNAADAMGDGGEVLFTFAKTGGAVRMTVEDSGRGIPTHHEKDIFRPFFTTKNRGTGLGLAICKKIMDAHGGKIELAASNGDGARISMEFPIRVSPQVSLEADEEYSK